MLGRNYEFTFRYRDRGEYRIRRYMGIEFTSLSMNLTNFYFSESLRFRVRVFELENLNFYFLMGIYVSRNMEIKILVVESNYKSQ